MFLRFLLNFYGHFLLTNQLTPWRQNPKVHHRNHNSPPTVPILSQVNPLHTPQPISLRPILSPSSHLRLRLSSGPFSFGLSHQNPVHVTPLSRACHMPCPPHSPWFDLPNNIWWWVQIMKLPTVQLSPFSRYFLPLRSKYSPQHPVLKHPQSMLFP
jgi:hypothetical protein